MSKLKLTVSIIALLSTLLNIIIAQQKYKDGESYVGWIIAALWSIIGLINILIFWD